METCYACGAMLMPGVICTCVLIPPQPEPPVTAARSAPRLMYRDDTGNVTPLDGRNANYEPPPGSLAVGNGVSPCPACGGVVPAGQVHTCTGHRLSDEIDKPYQHLERFDTPSKQEKAERQAWLQSASGIEVGNWADGGVRHRTVSHTGLRVLDHLLGVTRHLTGGTTPDGTWGELEKRLSNIISRSVLRGRHLEMLGGCVEVTSALVQMFRAGLGEEVDVGGKAVSVVEWGQVKRWESFLGYGDEIFGDDWHERVNLAVLRDFLKGREVVPIGNPPLKEGKRGHYLFSHVAQFHLLLVPLGINNLFVFELRVAGEKGVDDEH